MKKRMKKFVPKTLSAEDEQLTWEEQEINDQEIDCEIQQSLPIQLFRPINSFHNPGDC